VRVALLGIDIAAVSNTESPDTIHGMIDRYKQAALPFRGPPLVSDYYRRVPLGSIIWTIGRPPAASSSQDHGELLLLAVGAVCCRQTVWLLPQRGR